VPSSRIVYRDGVPVAAREANVVRMLHDVDTMTAAQVTQMLTARVGRARAVVAAS